MDALIFSGVFHRHKECAILLQRYEHAKSKDKQRRRRQIKRTRIAMIMNTFQTRVKWQVQQAKDGLLVTRPLSIKSCAPLLIIGSR